MHEHPTASSSAALPTSIDRLEGPRDLAMLHRDVWAVLRARPLTFVLLPVLFWLPFDVLGELAASASGDDVFRQIRAMNRVSNFASLIVGTLLAATFAWTLREMGAGRSPSMGASLRGGFTVWGSVFRASFVAGLLAGLATLLLVLPGIYFFVCWALVVPVVVFEGLTTQDAMRRSRALVQQRGFFTVLGYALAIYLVYLVLAMLPAFGAGAALELVGLGENTAANAVVGALTSAPINVLTSALVIGAVLLFVDVSGARALSPVGNELVAPDGARVSPPRGTGRPAFVAASVAAGVALVVVGVLVAAFAEEAGLFEDEAAVLGD